jgi:hypothetical protein
MCYGATRDDRSDGLRFGCDGAVCRARLALHDKAHVRDHKGEEVLDRVAYGQSAKHSVAKRLRVILQSPASPASGATAVHTARSHRSGPLASREWRSRARTCSSECSGSRSSSSAAKGSPHSPHDQRFLAELKKWFAKADVVDA